MPIDLGTERPIADIISASTLVMSILSDDAIMPFVADPIQFNYGSHG